VSGRATAVIAVSRIIEDYVEKRYGVRPRYIPNGASIVPGKGLRAASGDGGSRGMITSSP